MTNDWRSRAGLQLPPDDLASIHPNRATWSLISLFFVLHLCLCFAGIGEIEFFGEDEVSTGLVAARVILGTATANLYNIAAPLSASHPPIRYLVQIPFQAILGTSELSMYLPNIMGSALVFWILIGIGRMYLRPVGLVLLAVLYSTGAAYVINRSPNGHGVFIGCLLSSFLLTERYRLTQDNRARVAAWFVAALGTLTYLEGVVFIPYLFFYLILPGLRTVDKKELSNTFVSILAYVLPISAYVIVFLLLPTLVFQRPIGNLAHLLARQNGVRFFGNNLGMLGRDYYYTFGPCWSILFAASIVLCTSRIRRMPAVLARLTLFFGLFFAVWLFLFDKECGHTLYGYPVILLCKASVLQKGYTLLKKLVWRSLFGAYIAALAMFSIGYCYTAYNVPNPRKELCGRAYYRDYLPCGVNYAHKVGLKSSAYLIREASPPQDLFVSNVGEAMSWYLLDRKSPQISLAEIIAELDSEPQFDVYASYSIRFIGVVVTAETVEDWMDTLSKYSPPLYVVRQNNGEPSFVVWDTQETPTTSQNVDVGEFDCEFDEEFSAIAKRYASWKTYQPGRD